MINDPVTVDLESVVAVARMAVIESNVKKRLASLTK